MPIEIFFTVLKPMQFFLKSETYSKLSLTSEMERYEIFAKRSIFCQKLRGGNQILKRIIDRNNMIVLAVTIISKLSELENIDFNNSFLFYLLYLLTEEFY